MEEISILSKHNFRLRVVPVLLISSSETVNKPREKNGHVNSRDHVLLADFFRGFTFMRHEFISAKSEEKLFVCNMRLKQLNLQESMQLKRHCFSRDYQNSNKKKY